MYELIEGDTGEVGNIADENISVRRSSRPHKQRMEIDDEAIGDCDDKNDPDYAR